jgi:hypothetical protein
VSYKCSVKLCIPGHDLTTSAAATDTQTYSQYSTTDPGLVAANPGLAACTSSVSASRRSNAVCRAMKRCYQAAVECAFSHVLLVLVDNKKLFVEVNSATDDLWPTHSDTVQVNTLTCEPETEEDIETSHDKSLPAAASRGTAADCSCSRTCTGPS